MLFYLKGLFLSVIIVFVVSCSPSTETDIVIPIVEDVSGNTPKTLEEAHRLVHRGDSLIYVGGTQNYFEARWHYHDAVDIFSDLIGKNNADYARALSAEGDCICFLINNIEPQDEPDVSEAIECYEEALAIQGGLLGKHHPSYIKTLFGLEYANWMGAPQFDVESERIAFADQNGALAEMKNLPGSRTDYLTSLTLLGDDYYGKPYYYFNSSDRDDYSSAITYYSEIVRLLDTDPSRNENLYIRTLHRLGNCYREIDSTRTAIVFLSEALEEQERVHGKQSSLCCDILYDLAFTFYSQKEYDKAIEAGLEALALNVELFGDNPSLFSADMTYNLGMYYYHAGFYEECISYLTQSDEIWSYLSGYGAGLHNASDMIGDSYMEIGDYQSAIRYYLAAIEYNDKMFPGGLSKEARLDWAVFGLDYSRLIHNLAICYDKLNNRKQAGIYYGEYIDVIVKAFKKEFTYSIDKAFREWESYAGKFYQELPYITLRQGNNKHFLPSSYNGALFSKGLLLNAETELRSLILESGDPHALELYDSRQTIKNQLDSLAHVKSEDLDADEIQRLQDSSDAIFQQLILICKPFGDYTRNLSIGWEDVKGTLGKDDIAIEFLEVPVSIDDTAYCALTLKRGYNSPHYVKLFDLKDLESLINQYSRRGSLEGQIYEDKELYDLVWKPLRKELRGVNNIYFSPSGELHQIAIEYANTGKGPFSDKKRISRLSSTRQLVTNKGNAVMETATVFGGFHYGASEEVLMADSYKYQRPTLKKDAFFNVDSIRIRGAIIEDYGVKDLPETEEEVKVIATELTQAGINTRLVTGESGTEAAFKDLTGKREDLIHIATHGFYWDGQEARQIGECIGRRELMIELEEQGEDASMTRSGLLFTGANNALRKGYKEIDGVDDGILTAKEISQLDLRDAKLLVLSACETGLGEVSGEGVFGLQRGFKKAGVETMMMSLWEVDDEATQMLMTSFYKNLVAGLSKPDALRAAQNAIRGYDDRDFSVPFYWAAFILLDALD